MLAKCILVNPSNRSHTSWRTTLRIVKERWSAGLRVTGSGRTSLLKRPTVCKYKKVNSSASSLHLSNAPCQGFCWGLGWAPPEASHTVPCVLMWASLLLLLSLCGGWSVVTADTIKSIGCLQCQRLGDETLQTLLSVAFLFLSGSVTHSCGLPVLPVLLPPIGSSI